MKKHLFFIASLFLLGTLFVFWGLPYSDIGFVHDDFGILLNGRIDCWKSLSDIFTSYMQSLQNSMIALKSGIVNDTSFVRAYYRPLCVLLAALSNLLFGLNAYYYYLLLLFLHWVNAVLILKIFSWFVEFRYAFLGVLLFTFNGALTWFSRAVSVSQDVLSLSLIFPIIFVYKKFLETGCFRYHFFSALLFLISTGAKETPAIIPVIMVLFVLMFACNEADGIFSTIQIVLRKTWLFFVGLFVYIVWRMYIFGFGSTDHVSLSNVPIKGKIWGLIELCKDLFGFTFFKTTSPWGKVYLLLPIGLVLLLLFIRSNRKKELAFLASATLLLSWPSILLHHIDRYIYPALPFFILFLVTVLRDLIENMKMRFKMLLPYCLVGGIALWGLYDYGVTLRYLEKVSSSVKPAVLKLVLDYPAEDLKNTVFISVGVPRDVFFSGVKQAIALYTGRKNDDLSVYEVSRAVFSLNRGVWENCNVIVKPIVMGYRLVSQDPQKIFWAVGESDIIGERYPMDMGYFVINKKYDKYKSGDISVFFDNNYLEGKNTKFISWDMASKEFIYLENVEK